MSYFKSLSVLLLGTSPLVFAAAPESHFRLGMYESSITYTEPGVMQEKGYLTGIIGQYELHQNDQAIMLDAMYSSGDMDYNGSGTLNGIPDRIFETRGLLGHDFYTQNGFRLTPYFGLGYRNLNDNSSHMVTSTNYVGYEREQEYWYLPFGIAFQQMMMPRGWQVAGRVEYDSLIKGINHTYLSSIPGKSDLKFHQNSGSGFRVSMDFSKPISSMVTFTIRPFYKYWHIQRSNYVYANGAYNVEPDNNSKEFGVAVLLTY